MSEEIVHSFYYSIVRYVPDVVRDEGVNIGVVLEAEGEGQRTKELLFTKNYKRAALLDPYFTGRALDKILRSSIGQIMKYAGDTELDLNELAANYSGSRIQLTQPRITFADDPKKEVKDLYSQFVYEQEAEREHGKSDQTLKKEVRNIFSEHGINHGSLKYSTPTNPLRVKGKRTTHGFDLSVDTDGHTDLFRCISFDVDDFYSKLDAAKVLTYDARDVREETPQVDIISVLYRPIRNPLQQKKEAFQESRDILQDEGIETFDFASMEDRDQLLGKLQRQMTSSM